MTGAIGDQREDLRALIVNAREASEQLKTTLVTTDGAVDTTSTGTWCRSCRRWSPSSTARWRKLDSAGQQRQRHRRRQPRARSASFANDGLAQVGPTLAELRALVRDLRRVSDRLDGNPAGYLLGRDAPKEFEPK